MMDMADVRADIKATLAGSTKPDPIPTQPSDSAGTHKVVKSETLWSIAEKYKVSVDNLMKWNNLKTDVLDIGQVLIVKEPTGGGKVATKDATYKSVWDLDAATPPKGRATETNKTWAPMSILKGLYENVDALAKKIEELSKKIDALETK
jgi:LysM repeat protein